MCSARPLAPCVSGAAGGTLKLCHRSEAEIEQQRLVMTIIAIFWEHEDELPEMAKHEYDLIFPKSEVRDGVRMFPYVWIDKDDESGEAEKAFLS
jgi:hypothetical protein